MYYLKSSKVFAVKRSPRNLSETKTSFQYLYLVIWLCLRASEGKKWGVCTEALNVVKSCLCLFILLSDSNNPMIVL